MSVWDTLTALAKEFLGDNNAVGKVNLSKISKEVHRPRGISKQLGTAAKIEDFDISTIEVLPEYNLIVEAIKKNCSGIFVTGKAGTGKSTLIKYLTGTIEGIAVVAPTAIAAINVEGVTIHSFFGIPPRPINPGEVFSPRKNMAPVFENLKALIVDEVSMVSPDIIDCMHNSLKKIKRSNLPFGGVPVVFVGDILQLPPIVQEREVGVFFTHRYDSPNFYSAEVFKEIEIFPVELTKVFRQANQEFVDALSRIRINQDHRASVALLNRRCYRDKVVNTEYSVWLVTTNAAARSINERKLDAIEDQIHTFEAEISGKINPSKIRFPAPDTLNLKTGARVIFVHNNKPLWHNGTLGEIVELESDSLRVKILDTGNIVSVSRHTWKRYRYAYDYESRQIRTETIGQFTQFPISLGWAITIHKSQGMTLDSVHVDLGSGAFCTGQTYVALSRCKTIEGLSLAKPISMGDVQVDHTAIEFYKKLGFLVLRKFL